MQDPNVIAIIFEFWTRTGYEPTPCGLLPALRLCLTSSHHRTLHSSISFSFMIFATFVVLIQCTSALSLSSFSSTTGVVDAAANVDGGVICVLDSEPCDVMLSLQDPARNMDKFYVLQMIEHNARFTVLTKWGRTGQNGTPRTYEVAQYAEAERLFRTKFRQKTGLTWEARRAPPKPRRYRIIRQNFVEKQRNYTSGSWEYWVDDGVDGKTDGWYEYTPSGSQLVEQLYQEHLLNKKFFQRWVRSGRFTCKIRIGSLPCLFLTLYTLCRQRRPWFVRANQCRASKPYSSAYPASSFFPRYSRERRW